jgi:hypothetical protein
MDNATAHTEASGPDESESLRRHAYSLLDSNAYLTLGTVDALGRPWVTPVFFAADGFDAFYWVSDRQSRHSRNLSGQPHMSIVVFDSTVAPYHGRALYATASATAVDQDGLERALAVYPGPARRGGRRMVPADVTGESSYRMYVGRPSRIWVLCPREPRRPCALHGRAEDHRALVT